MVKLISIDNHFAIKLTSDIQQICEPLFKYTPISFFNFVRIYNDRRRLSLGTNAQWLEHYFQKQYQNEAVFNYNQECINHHYILFDNYPINKVIVDAQNFDICHGITLSKPSNSYIDFYHFAANQQQSQILNFYINNFDLLERFVLYFINKTEKILKIVKPYVPEDNQPSILEDKKERLLTREKFIEETKLKKIHLDPGDENCYLTQQEINCLKQLLQGCSSKEAAKRIHLSHRTVEYYLARVKDRFNATTVSDLFEILAKYHVLHHL